MKLPQRKSPRLKDYDYSQSGAYFVTICTHNRKHYFGHIKGENIDHNIFGKIAHEAIDAIPSYWSSVEIDWFVVMPNHIHLIVLITDTPNQSPLPELGKIIGNYKSGVTRRIRKIGKQSDFRLWHTSYHDHIIRNEIELNKLREYIMYNPARWVEDTFYS